MYRYRDVPKLRTTVLNYKPGKLIDFGTTSVRRFRNGTIFIYCTVLVPYGSTTMYTGTVQYSTVQYGTVRYSTVQYGTVQYSTYGTVQYSTVQYSTGPVQYISSEKSILHAV